VAVKIAKNSMRLTWTDNSNNEAGFKLQRSTDRRTWVTVAKLGANASSYTDSVAHRTVYYYRITAYNYLGNSGFSAVASSGVSAGSLPKAAESPAAARAGLFSAVRVREWELGGSQQRSLLN
jgi:hypothetical protein